MSLSRIPRLRGYALHATLVTAVICNVALLAAWLWSRDGSDTTVRIDVHADAIQVSVDGELRNDVEVAEPAPGGVIVHAVNERLRIDSLPGEAVVKRVRVTSLDDGAVLFEEEAPPVRRLPPNGRPAVADLSANRWRNYSVEVTYKNLIEGRIELTRDGDAAATYDLRRIAAHTSALIYMSPSGPATDTVSGDIDGRAAAQVATGIVLRGYPFAVIIVVLALAAAAALQRWPVAPREFPAATRFAAPAAVGAMAVALIVAASIFIADFGDGVPHVADEAAYLWQSRILASGRTHLDTPPVPEAFSFSYTPFIIDYDGRWASFYTFGHPLTLVPGTLVGAPWIIPGLVAAASALMLYAVGKRMFNATTGVLAAALFATSPFALMQAGSWMSHNTAGMWLLATVLALVSLKDRPLVSGALAGVAFGMFFNTRPLSGVVLSVPLGLWMLSLLIPADQRLPQAKRIAAFVCGALTLFGAYLLYNWSITGSPFENGYQASGDLGEALGFGGAHSVSDGINLVVFNLAALAETLNGWPGYVGFAFVLVAFVAGRARAFEWFLVAGAVAIISSSTLFNSTGHVFGPRYVYEALPLLLLLTARGFDVLADIVSPNIDLEAPTPRSSASAGSLVVGGFAAALVAVSASGWLLGWTDTLTIPGLPSSAASVRDDSRIDDRLIRAADDMRLHDALVVIHPCDFVRTCYLSVFLENNLSLDGDVVWVYDIGPEGNARVEELYPCRDLYTADYAAGTITPAGRTPPPPGETCEE
jgi:hypothetical protein